MRSPVYIIAEAGVNHNGDFELAKSLIEIASNAGADAVKFQTFDASKLANKNLSKAKYQETNTKNSNETQYDMLKKLELDLKRYAELKIFSDSLGIDFLSTAFDEDSLNFLLNLGVKKLKIPSGEVSNLPFIWKIARSNKPLIVSTGMCNISDVEMAIATIFHSHHSKSEPTSLDEIWDVWSKRAEGLEFNHEVSILHCTSQYPASLSEINLRCINTLKQTFGLPVGYSDHSDGIEVSLAAVAMGASVIEKHFTLDKSFEGPDHKASLNPIELTEMISGIRNIEEALGSSIKNVQPSELNTKLVVRQQVIAAKSIKKGTKFSRKDLSTRRSGSGLPPHFIWTIVGTEAKNDFKAGDLIEL